MELPSNFHRQEKYKDFFLPVFSALGAAHTIVCYKQSQNPLEVVLVNGYFFAMGFSFVVALLIFYAINFVSWILDRYYPWERSKWKRLWLQLVYGVGATMLLDLIVNAKYLYNQGHEISDTVHLDEYFFMILSYVVIVNMYYNAEAMVFWKYLGKVASVKSHSESPDTLSATQQLVATPTENVGTHYPEVYQPRNYDKELDPALKAGLLKNLLLYDIVLFYSVKGNVYIVEASGKTTEWAFRLSATIRVLDPEYYFLASRYHIVRRDAIKRVLNEPMKNKVTLFLTTPCEEIISVTRSHINDFNAWW